MISELSRYSPTKPDTAVMDTPRSITVINQQDILDKGAMSLDDTFMYSAGVTDQPYAFESRADSVFIRGFKATQYQDS